MRTIAGFSGLLLSLCHCLGLGLGLCLLLGLGLGLCLGLCLGHGLALSLFVTVCECFRSLVAHDASVGLLIKVPGRVHLGLTARAGLAKLGLIAIVRRSGFFHFFLRSPFLRRSLCFTDSSIFFFVTLTLILSRVPRRRRPNPAPMRRRR